MTRLTAALRARKSGPAIVIGSFGAVAQAERRDKASAERMMFFIFHL
jgi:hypothetical protein